jgi:hypothetical protein
MIQTTTLSVALKHLDSRTSNQNDLFVEQAEGYVKALEKSTSRVLNWREVFEHCAQND